MEENEFLKGQEENSEGKKLGKQDTQKIMKSELKFLTMKNKQLEEKLKIQEVKSDNQFEHIVKLEEKCKTLKEACKGQIPKDKSSSNLKMQELTEVFEKLTKKYGILQHSKETDSKKHLNLKSGYEKKLKTLYDRISQLEGELIEKEKENRLHAMKVKDMNKKIGNEQLQRRMSRGSRHSKIRIRDSAMSGDQNLNRARSIDPFGNNVKQNIHRNVCIC